MPGSYCYGWTGAAWKKILVDGGGHLQVDVLSSDLPADFPLPAAQIALLQAVTVGNFPATYPLSAAQIASLQQVTEQGTPSVHLYGYDTAAWQYLQVESDVHHNLRVKLFDEENAIDSDLLDSSIFVSGDRGILTRSQVCGYNLEPFLQRRSDSDALAAVARELCQMNVALLYGYNGTTFDRLRTESPTAFNLRVKLYDGATGIDSASGASTNIVDATRGLVVDARQRVSRHSEDLWGEVRSANNLGDDEAGYYFTGIGLYGFNSVKWDRLRTYNTGILKVGRAPIGATTLRVTDVGQVGTAAAKKLYWISCSPDAPGAEFELTDATEALQAIVLDHFDPDKHSEMLTFDPPMEFANGIWIEKFDHIHSLVFCYE